jgi:WD40 repeat protein
MRSLFFLLSLGTCALAEEAVNFSRDVAPILHRRCVQCHQAEDMKGRYRLDTFTHLLKPGETGLPPVEPGQPEQSALYTLLVEPAAGDRMPQKAGPLPETEISLIHRWIAQGAPYDGGSADRPLIELVRDRFLGSPPAQYPRAIPIVALAFSPDGGLLAVGGYHEIALWQWRESRRLTRIVGLPERITALSWHPALPQIAIAGGTPMQWGGVVLADPAGLGPHRILCDLPETPLAVAFDPTGRRLASGAGDRTVRLFDAATGKTERVLRPHADWVQALAFSPDGRLLATASRDRTARVIEAASGEVAATYTRHDAAVIDAAFSSSGERVWTLARGGALHRWVAADGSRKADLKPADLLHFETLGDRIASLSSDRKLRLHEGEKLEAKHVVDFPGARPASLARTTDGRLLAAGFSDGTVAILDAETGEILRHFSTVPELSENPLSSR